MISISVTRHLPPWLMPGFGTEPHWSNNAVPDSQMRVGHWRRWVLAFAMTSARLVYAFMLHLEYGLTCKWCVLCYTVHAHDCELMTCILFTIRITISCCLSNLHVYNTCHNVFMRMYEYFMLCLSLPRPIVRAYFQVPVYMYMCYYIPFHPHKSYVKCSTT